MTMPVLKKPCASCPWRKDQDARDIPNFDLALAERLTATCPDDRGFGPDYGATTFACHQSKVDHEFYCAGWLAQVGNCHPNVRIDVRFGVIPEDALAPKEDWPELHDTYGEVLAKLRATDPQNNE